MKRLIAIVALLFATSAFAVDNKVPCTGASCKVQLAPHDGSNVQQTVLTADGVNTRVGIGSTTPGATLDVNSTATVTVGLFKTTATTTAPVLDVQGNNGSVNAGVNNGLHIQIDNTSVNRYGLQIQSGDTPATVFEVDGDGSTKVQGTLYGAQTNANGPGLRIGTASAANGQNSIMLDGVVRIYYSSGGNGVSCTTDCGGTAATNAGLTQSSSAQCFGAWNSASGAVLTCADTSANGHQCICLGF